MSSRCCADVVGVEFDRLEDGIVGLEIDRGAVPAKRADLFQLARRRSLGVGLLPLVTVAANGGDQLARQGVDDRGADAVQAAGIEVAVGLAELAAGMQHGEHQFQARFFVLRVQIDGDAATVVGDRNRGAGLVQRHGDVVAVAVQVFVDGIVDDFPDQMVQALIVDAADIHRRPLADGLQAFENLDRVGGCIRLQSGAHAIAVFSMIGADRTNFLPNQTTSNSALRQSLSFCLSASDRWPTSFRIRFWRTVAKV